MIKAVFFDLDGTLYDRDATVAGIFAEQRETFATELQAVGPDAFVARAIALDNHGYCRTREVYDTVAQEFGLRRELAEHLTTHYWARFDHHCRPSPGVIDTLAELRRRGKLLGIITNGTAVFQEHKIDVLGLRPLMNAVLVSESEGVSKPDRAIFERAASRMGVKASQCCYVGDHPELDIAGATNAGMFPIWKQTPYWSVPESVRTIRAIGEVLSNL